MPRKEEGKLLGNSWDPLFAAEAEAEVQACRPRQQKAHIFTEARALGFCLESPGGYAFSLPNSIRRKTFVRQLFVTLRCASESSLNTDPWTPRRPLFSFAPVSSAIFFLKVMIRITVVIMQT